jgi:hypothetical protein
VKQTGLRLLSITTLLFLLLGARPAAACGCGAYIPREGEAHVAQERALIRWDGHREDIVMALDVQGSSTEAAWILPVPAQATVQLGEAELFETLQALTRPRVQYQYALLPPSLAGPGSVMDGVTGGAPPVLLLQQQTLGPFEVSTLAATNASALSDWLAEHGYSFPEGLAGVLQPYVEQQWVYIAIRLTPGVNGEELTGQLEPLWITFQSETLVYPMRATALATGTMPVYLYVLAEHRVEKVQSFGDTRVSFADWVEPASLPADSPLRPFVERKLFLTKFEERIWEPAQVNNDFVFSFTAQDEIYHDVKIEYVYDIGGLPIIFIVLAGVCVAGLGVGGGLIFFLVFWQRRRAAI